MVVCANCEKTRVFVCLVDWQKQKKTINIKGAFGLTAGLVGLGFVDQAQNKRKKEYK